MDSGLLIDVDIDWGIDPKPTSTLSVACFVHPRSRCAAAPACACAAPGNETLRRTASSASAYFGLQPMPVRHDDLATFDVQQSGVGQLVQDSGEVLRCQVQL